ncbi:hypothetical protein T10_7968 [Trichinella papuae]|uniref:Uncharacterized protein n=1 Tax=Trichinella papuae TaxID=268474 RepID=A0A0V1MIT7_9BILA|nr:hypothetical protein T10_7968 [Trichinella papuae]
MAETRTEQSISGCLPRETGKPVGHSPEGNVSYSFRTECQYVEQFKQQQEKPEPTPKFRDNLPTPTGLINKTRMQFGWRP